MRHLAENLSCSPLASPATAIHNVARASREQNGTSVFKIHWQKVNQPSWKIIEHPTLLRPVSFTNGAKHWERHQPLWILNQDSYKQQTIRSKNQKFLYDRKVFMFSAASVQMVWCKFLWRIWCSLQLKRFPMISLTDSYSMKIHESWSLSIFKSLHYLCLIDKNLRIFWWISATRQLKLVKRSYIVLHGRPRYALTILDQWPPNCCIAGSAMK